MAQLEHVLITGGNRGIGKSIAMAYAGQNKHVVIVSRDLVQGEAAVADIRRQTGNDRVECIQGTLSTINECRALVERIKARMPELQVLVHNAGVWLPQRTVNTDGFEMEFMVHYLGPYILSTGLADLLRRNDHARIILINSMTHQMGRFNLEKTPYGLDFSPMGTYTSTKMANAILAVNLARYFEGTGVTVNALHPGLFRTELDKLHVRNGVTVISLLVRPFMKPVEKAGDTPLWLGTDESLNEVTGCYFIERKRKPFAKRVLDAGLQESLREQTEAWMKSTARPLRADQQLT
jgi:retinol dehydrogenase-14